VVAVVLHYNHTLPLEAVVQAVEVMEENLATTALEETQILVVVVVARLLGALKNMVEAVDQEL
jgi:hypothetical protein